MALEGTPASRIRLQPLVIRLRLQLLGYAQQRVESHVEAEDISLSEMNTESPLRATLGSP